MKLQWPERPRRIRSTFGTRQRWVSLDGWYLIDRFVQSTGRFIAVFQTHGPQLLGDFRSLRSAQRACLAHARAELGARDRRRAWSPRRDPSERSRSPRTEGARVARRSARAAEGRRSRAREARARTHRCDHHISFGIVCRCDAKNLPYQLRGTTELWKS